MHLRSGIESFLTPCIFCIRKKLDYPTAFYAVHLNEPLVSEYLLNRVRTSPCSVGDRISVHSVPADLRFGHSRGRAGQLQVVPLLYDDRGVAGGVRHAGNPKIVILLSIPMINQELYDHSLLCFYGPRFGLSVTSKKSPNVFNSCLK